MNKHGIGGACGTSGEQARYIQGFGGEGKRSFGTYRCRWEDNIKLVANLLKPSGDFTYHQV
jgi:hypothetical protein